MPLIGFLALAFGFAWPLQLAVVLADIPLDSPVGMLLLTLAGITPSLAAVIMTAHGRRPVGELWGPPGKPPLRMLVLGFFLGSVVTLAAGGIYTLVDGVSPRFVFNPLLLGIMIIPPLGEELGWRGFAQARLLARRGPLETSLMVGVLWALWHIPTAFHGGDPSLAGYGMYALNIVAVSVIMGWLFERSGRRALSAVITHAGLNMQIVLLPDVMGAQLIRTGLYVALAVLAGLSLRASEPSKSRPAQPA